MKKLFFLILMAYQLNGFSQSDLTVDLIMQDPKWIGTSPSNLYWSRDGAYLFFNWNPDKNSADSFYYITPSNLTPIKASDEFRRKHISAAAGIYNTMRSGYIYENEGDIYYIDLPANKTTRVTQTLENESGLSFISVNKIAFSRNQNLYEWDRISGGIRQLTNFQKTTAPKEEVLSKYEQWLKDNQLATSTVLRTRKQKRDSAEVYRKLLQKERELRPIYIGDQQISDIRISPGGRFISYRLSKPVTNSKGTIIPNYVTESGFTLDVNERAKVGAPSGTSEIFIYDKKKDTVYAIKFGDLPGIKDPTDFAKAEIIKDSTKINKDRGVQFFSPAWNKEGTYAIVEVRSLDKKDRWILLMDTATMKLRILDRQRDEAWIAGPGIFPINQNSWLDEKIIQFQSETSGYSHLYKMDIISGVKEQITKGNFEVLNVTVSLDKKYFYTITNEVSPAEQQYYRLPITAGTPQRLTSLTGAHQVVISPDEKKLAYLYSYTNKPWELFIQDNKPGAKPIQVTNLARSEAFKKYNWRDPDLITIKASDGENIYARLYTPAKAHSSRPAVIFVHGAGYLQNAHKWWSTYFREYMFHNLLADLGYTVLDIDYRGSAGYGRNWRTGIYRHMGGKDLSDHVDAARFLSDKMNVNPRAIGIYGGSYGGFITLMAMFTQPEVFAAGAALRSVTDWAHYNHGYTSNILNEPYLDSISYKKSSPIYFAEGLKGALLMCHGMVDGNVHFQDIVRLTQRLIELKKENWELAVYPLEDHGFTEPSSWTDEYKRILKLFETNLKK